MSFDRHSLFLFWLSEYSKKEYKHYINVNSIPLYTTTEFNVILTAFFIKYHLVICYNFAFKTLST